MDELQLALASRKPLWFLDVDGVINCWPAPVHQQLMQSQDWRDGQVGVYKIWWRASVIDFINRLAKNDVQVVWLTTWMRAAADELAPLVGLDHFPAIIDGSGADWPDKGWWKWRRVREIVSEHQRPFVWTDDDIRRDVVEEAGKLAVPQLLIAPSSNPGLTDEHLQAINAFVTEVRDA